MCVFSLDKRVAQVVAARSNETGRRVALKVVFLDNPGLKKEHADVLRAEVVIMKQLKHTNIVRFDNIIYDSVRKQLVIAEEILLGGTLTDEMLHGANCNNDRLMAHIFKQAGTRFSFWDALGSDLCLQLLRLHNYDVYVMLMGCPAHCWFIRWIYTCMCSLPCWVNPLSAGWDVVVPLEELQEHLFIELSSCLKHQTITSYAVAFEPVLTDSFGSRVAQHLCQAVLLHVPTFPAPCKMPQVLYCCGCVLLGSSQHLRCCAK